jgi:hypothetical protein
MACPTGSNFNDSFGGLYGPGSYLVPSPYCEGGGDVLASTLAFQCVVCPPGQYSLVGGSSDGTAGVATNFPCLPCPVGGVCAGGVVGAIPGYWGAPDVTPPNASFAVCPAGYCCDGSATWPCTGLSPCGGHRTGALCGECAPGYVDSVGSAVCAATSACATDKVVFWSLVAGGEVLAAILQLTVVSGVWLPSVVRPSENMKLAIYFAQVGCGHHV